MNVFLVAGALLPHVLAASLPSSNSSCMDLVLPVPVTAHNAEYNLIHVDSSINATAFAIDIDTWSSPTPNDRLIRNITVSGTYNISAQLCLPPAGVKKSTLQIATHGLAVDKRYWDVPIRPSEYSYVKAATDAGYSILTYDRLGTGSSDKPDAYRVVQAPLELEILRGITEMARNGTLLSHARGNRQSNNSTSVNTRFEKVIHVGHSFGSFLTSAFLTTYPDLSDAALITGFILNSKFNQLRYTGFGLEYAHENDPKLFGDRGSGYMVSGAKSPVQTLFLSTRANTTTGTGGFEPALLEYAYSVRQTITASEIVSASQLNLGVAPNFKGPVHFMLAEFDFPGCQGDCRGVYNASMVRAMYPKAKAVDFAMQEGTGHGLTFHRGANLGYKVMLNWLGKNGL